MPDTLSPSRAADLTVLRTREAPRPADFAEIAAVLRAGELVYQA